MIFCKMLVLALSNIDKVFWVSPNVRKELNVKTAGRYATEFTQIDFESSLLDFESCLNLIEEVITNVVNTLADEEGDTIHTGIFFTCAFPECIFPGIGKGILHRIPAVNVFLVDVSRS